jgi:GMP synthase-like glutamine amidotransferase
MTGRSDPLYEALVEHVLGFSYGTQVLTAAQAGRVGKIKKELTEGGTVSINVEDLKEMFAWWMAKPNAQGFQSGASMQVHYLKGEWKQDSTPPPEAAHRKVVQ